MAVRRPLSFWVGMAIRQEREARGLSQEELAARARLHRTYVSMVERAIRNISVDALAGIAEALDCSPAELVRSAEQLRGRRGRSLS